MVEVVGCDAESATHGRAFQRRRLLGVERSAGVELMGIGLAFRSRSRLIWVFESGLFVMAICQQCLDFQGYQI
jgi:hypothetical protein